MLDGKAKKDINVFLIKQKCGLKFLLKAILENTLLNLLHISFDKKFLVISQRYTKNICTIKNGKSSSSFEEILKAMTKYLEHPQATGDVLTTMVLKFEHYSEAISGALQSKSVFA